MNAFWQIAYTLLVGIPLCLMLCSVGMFFFCTIVGIPIGITLIALGVKVLTISVAPKPSKYTIRLREGGQQ